MQRNTAQYIIVSVLCLALISVGLYAPAGWFFGVLGAFGLLSFVVYHGALLAATGILSKIHWPVFWSSWIVLLGTLLLHSPIYFFYVSTPNTIFGSFCTIALIVHVVTQFRPIRQLGVMGQLKVRGLGAPETLLAVLTIVSQLFVLYFILLNRTTDLLQSPWHAFHYSFFLFYGISLFLVLFYQLKAKGNALGLLLLSFQFFLTFTLAAIIYKIGYGYDPFLHRATERHIFEFGFAEPKTLFYIGQFVTVNVLAHVTNIAVKTIDIWLVPVSASILLPISAFYGLHYGLKMPSRWARIGAGLMLLYPMKTMIATTPHNVANLLTLVFIFLIPVYFRWRKFLWILLFTAAMAVMTHPLTGIFAGWLFIGIVLLRYKELKKYPQAKRAAIAVYALMGLILTPLLFSVFLLQQGLPLNSLGVIRTKLTEFYALFQPPYYFLEGKVHFLYDLIYLHRWGVVGLLVVLGLAGVLLKNKKPFFLFALFPALLISNAFFVVTWLSLPNTQLYEQRQYAERLTHVVVFFLLPFALFALVHLLRKMREYHRDLIMPAFMILALLMTCSFYLLYPQKNPRVNFPGFHITGSDVRAAQFIHGATTTDYIVLSNILTAAASIDQYGFMNKYYGKPGASDPLFYYSIPPGGKLYKQYLNMLYEGQKREYMESAMDTAGVDRAYFVINDYWVNFEKIVSSTKQVADDLQVIDGGKVMVFTFEREPNQE